jgi:hypothetical protein
MLRGGLLLAFIAGVFLTGCVERRLYLRSDPPGADVYIDGELVGQTRREDHPDGPLFVNFIYYGTREYTVRKVGYATASGEIRLETPWYEYPPVDFFAEVLAPWPIINEHRIDVKLELAQPADVDKLYAGAKKYREESNPGRRRELAKIVGITQSATPQGQAND